MTYLTSWAEYARRAEELYGEAPTRTRYVVKYRGDKGCLVLKITDDVTCLKYKTHSALILNRFEALNLALMRRMRNRVVVVKAEPVPVPVSAPAPGRKESAPVLGEKAVGAAAGSAGGSGATPGGGAGAASGAGGGAGKKKKKKGKK